MKKNHYSMVSMLLRVWKCKTLLVMRLTLLICLFFAFQSIAIEAFSQNQRLSINQKNIKIEDIIQLIENKTDYYFMYSTMTVNVERTVDIEATDKLITEILSDIFKGTNVSYKIDGRVIALSRNGEESIIGQQSHSVSGKVVDSSGAPLPGVSVVIKGTTSGVITDADGKFSLAKISEDATLQFSFVGMKTLEINVHGKTDFNVVMEDSTIGLDEVVAVGYGTVKKKDLTGSVASVAGEMLASRKTTQLSSALQGAMPGVMVTNSANSPEGVSSIRIRGITTIGSSDPLCIVDGIPSDLNKVNPNDVESISVLKDAASAAIYGSRAAAGVILVTTKRAKDNKFNMNYSYNNGWNEMLTLPSYVNTQQYAAMINEVRHNDNPNGGLYPVYTQDQVTNWLEYNKTDPDHYPNTNWADVLLRNPAPQQNHSISISAGAKKIRTKASFNSDRIDGFYEGRSYKRYLIRVNNDLEINRYISISLDLNVKRQESERPNYDPTGKLNYLPYVPALFSDGRYGTTAASVDNPYNILKQGGTYNESLFLTEGRASIDITPFDGLKISGVFDAAYDNNKYKTFKKAVPYTYFDTPNMIAGYVVDWQTTKLTENRNDFYKGTAQFLVNYTKKIGKHNTELTAGYENYNSTDEYLSASRDQYQFDKYPYLNLGPLSYRDNSGSASSYAYRSYFGRLNYAYADKYLFQFNFRSDGSSRFNSNYRWGYFPSVSTGWVLSEENFFKKSPINWLSFLKLRASWGALGNERLSSVYPSVGLIDFQNALFYKNGVATSALSAAQTTYNIESISWEKTESYDVGIDANFFDNRLQFSGDYYKKTTKDMLLSLEIPKYVGYDNPQQNTGKMHTTGWEISLGWNDKIKDFRYRVNLNVSDFISTMGNLGGTEFLGDQIKKQGSEYNEWYGYLSDGLFQTQADLANSPKLNNNIKVGDVKYKDVSGPNGVPDGKISAEYDKVFLGGSLPRYMYGATVNVGYKNWDASIVFQGVGHQNVRFPTSLIWATGANFSKYIVGKYWSDKNSDEENAKARFPRLTESNLSSNNALSDFWMMNGRYLRLKNIMVGYTLPLRTWVPKSYVESLRIYFSGNNLLCFDKYPEGIDPESITKTILFGLSVNF